MTTPNTVDRNAVTTNAYLTTQTHEIDGTTGASRVPELGTWGTCAMSLVGLGAIWLGKRKRVSARWGLLPVLAFAIRQGSTHPMRRIGIGVTFVIPESGWLLLCDTHSCSERAPMPPVSLRVSRNWRGSSQLRR